MLARIPGWRLIRESDALGQEDGLEVGIVDQGGSACSERRMRKAESWRAKDSEHCLAFQLLLVRLLRGFGTLCQGCWRLENELKQR